VIRSSEEGGRRENMAVSTGELASDLALARGLVKKLKSENKVLPIETVRLVAAFTALDEGGAFRQIDDRAASTTFVDMVHAAAEQASNLARSTVVGNNSRSAGGAGQRIH
jgi:hypothetical protein